MARPPGSAAVDHSPNLSPVAVNPERLRREVETLGEFGRADGGGVMRAALSEADGRARRWFRRRMEKAGLDVREDAAANIIGRLHPNKGNRKGPCIAVGSHIDAVPNGGRFDGALGICAALEALRSIRESGAAFVRPLELIVFTDEEGGHFAGTFGSRAMLGLLNQGEIHKSKGSGVEPLARGLERMGKDPGKVGAAERPRRDFLAYLELHIEQGPVLDALKIPIGIVEGIVFLDRSVIEVSGKAGHAGTTPMAKRDDALVKAARLITSLDRLFRSAGSGLVGTIGELKVHPGAFNIIPERVEMSLDLRAMKKGVLRDVRRRVREIARSLGNVNVETLMTKGGASMHPAIMKAIEESCLARGVRFKRMASGAGHDAMTFPAREIPAGMIFVPCIDGKSHCPEESIRWEDAAIGTQILADTILRLA